MNGSTKKWDHNNFIAEGQPIKADGENWKVVGSLFTKLKDKLIGCLRYHFSCVLQTVSCPYIKHQCIV